MNTSELICTKNLPLKDRPPIPWTKVGRLFRWGRKPEILLVLLDAEKFKSDRYTWEEIWSMANDDKAHYLVYSGWDSSFGGHTYTMGGILFCASEFAPARMIDNDELELIDDGWPYWKSKQQ